jgi:hypothetical protein
MEGKFAHAHEADGTLVALARNGRPLGPWFMTWLLCANRHIFKILHTKFIFRETIVRTRTVVCELQTETGSVGI